MKIGELLLQDCSLGKMWFALRNTTRCENLNVATSSKKYTQCCREKSQVCVRSTIHVLYLGSSYTEDNPHHNFTILLKSFFVVLTQKLEYHLKQNKCSDLQNSTEKSILSLTQWSE